MTPEREREIRKIAGRDGQTWRSSAVSLVALNEVLDELDAERATNAKRDRLACEMVTTAATVLGEAQRQIVEARAERDELRQRVTAFEAFAHERRDTYERMAQRDECDFPVDARAFAAMQMAFNEAIVQGLDLGLFTEDAP